MLIILDDLKDFIIWTMIETGVGIISASLPPLRPLLNATLRSVGLSRDGSKNPSGRSDRMTIGGGSGKKKSSKSSDSTTTSTLIGVTTTYDVERGPFKQLHEERDYELDWVDGHDVSHFPGGTRNGRAYG